MEFKNRNSLILGAFLITGWLFLAVYFHAERLYGDAAYYLFQLVNDTRFVIEHTRPVSVFMQVIPYLLTVNHAPMSQIILWFSVNEWLYYALSFVILVVLFKDTNAALGLFFALIMGVRWNYFNHVSELILSTPLIFMAFSLMKRELNFFRGLMIILLLGMVIFSHPLNILIVGLLFLLLPLKHLFEFKRSFIAIALMVGGIVAAKYLTLDEYESGSFSGREGKSFMDVIDTLSKYNYARFIFSVIPAYAGCIILLVWIILKRKLVSGRHIYWAFSGFILFYFILVLYKYGYHFPKTYEPFERYLFLIPLMTSLFFFNYIHDLIKPRTLMVVLSLISVYHLSAIFIYGMKVDDRYRQLHRALDYAVTRPSDMIAIRGENYNVRYYGQDWIMSNESMLFTAVKGRANTKQVFIKEAVNDRIFGELKGEKYLYAPWWEKGLKTLNSNYFQMDNPVATLVNTDSSQMLLPDEFFSKISVKPAGSISEKIKRKSVSYFLFDIYNESDRPLFSGRRADGIAFRVQWKRASDNFTVITEYNSPVMVDVYKQVRQEIAFNAPKESGVYFWRVGLYFDNGRFVPVSDYTTEITVGK